MVSTACSPGPFMLTSCLVSGCNLIFLDLWYKQPVCLSIRFPQKCAISIFFCHSHLLYNLHLVNVAAQAVGRACGLCFLSLIQRLSIVSQSSFARASKLTIRSSSDIKQKLYFPSASIMKNVWQFQPVVVRGSRTESNTLYVGIPKYSQTSFVHNLEWDGSSTVRIHCPRWRRA